jgi:hypothetical protein
MENKSIESTTESLKLSLIKRVVLLIFGCIASTIVLGALPLLYLVPVSAEVSTRIRSSSDMLPAGAFVPPVLTIVMLGLIAYGIYDAIRMFIRYRKSRQDDQQMFI